MYKFFVKRNNTAKEIWVPYMEDIVTITPGKTVTNEEGNETTEPDTEVSEYKEWTTDDLAVLAEKYKELLAIYTTDHIKVIEELVPDILVDIVD